MKTTIWIVAIVLAVIVAVGVDLIFFPIARDSYFQMTQTSLQKVPAGMVVLRPTHFPTSTYHKGVVQAADKNARGSDKGVMRIMGRNVSLRQVFAVAYSEPIALVLLPPGAPTNNFDFLITVAKEPRKRLQAAIRSKLGYTAQMETQDADVLALKVENPNLPGLTVSSPDEKEDGSVKDGRMYITHMSLKELTKPFEQILGTPVVDETGLTNFYDFSLEWKPKVIASFRSAATARVTLDKMLTEWGLGLENDTAPVEMLVVKKAE